MNRLTGVSELDVFRAVGPALLGSGLIALTSTALDAAAGAPTTLAGLGLAASASVVPFAMIILVTVRSEMVLVTSLFPRRTTA